MSQNLSTQQNTEALDTEVLSSKLQQMKAADLLLENPELQAIYEIESPIARAMELLGDKYSFQILSILYQMDRQRFVELEYQIEGISPRTLSARLKHLERCGLISRHQFATIPPRVDYELTDPGRDLATTLNALETWAQRWYPQQKD